MRKKEICCTIIALFIIVIGVLFNIRTISAISTESMKVTNDDHQEKNIINIASQLSIDGEDTSMCGFKYNNSNFYCLRQLSHNMKNTNGRFNITNVSDNCIFLETGYNYTDNANYVYPNYITEYNMSECYYNICINNYFIDNIRAYMVDNCVFVNLRDFSNHLGYDLEYNVESDIVNIITCNSICTNIRDNIKFTYDPFTKIELNKEDIDKILKHSSIPYYGEYFCNMQDNYGVNIIYSIAVCYVESYRGKILCGSYNYFGMLGCNYSSPEEGINAFGKLMNKSLYYGKSIDQIGLIYCDSNWAPLIKSMMNEIWSYI